MARHPGGTRQISSGRRGAARGGRRDQRMCPQGQVRRGDRCVPTASRTGRRDRRN